MALPIPAVQQALKNDGLDGWLLYDFHGSNPIATRLTDLAASSKMATRRWYYLVPAEGAPRGLVHAIERHNLDGLPGEKRPYAGREQLAEGLKDLLRGMKRVAMEYSPGNAIPYVSRVDAGTVEAVRQLGVDVVSSGDLVQRFEAIWSDEALATHRAASERLYRIKDRAFRAGQRTRRAGTERVRGATGHGGMVRRGRADQRLSPGRGGPGERRQPALSADGGAQSGDRRQRNCAARPVGQAADARRGLC